MRNSDSAGSEPWVTVHAPPSYLALISQMTTLDGFCDAATSSLNASWVRGSSTASKPAFLKYSCTTTSFISENILAPPQVVSVALIQLDTSSKLILVVIVELLLLVSIWTTFEYKVSKSRLFKSLFKKNGFLAVSGSDLGWGLQLTTRLNKLLVSDSEAEQLLCQFQYIILLSLYQFSSSNWLYMLKSMKVLSYLCLDKTRFLVIYHRKWPTLCILFLWNLKGRP